MDFGSGLQNKFSEEELAKYSQEMGNAIAKAQELYSEYLEVLKNDDGQFTRDEKLLPASKETLRKAIIVVSIVSDDSPQVAVIADTLMRAWTALEFFGSPSKAPSEETLPLLFHRLESAGNSAAKEALNAYLEGYAKGTESSLAASTEWLQRVHASWQRQLSSGDTRIGSIQHFTDGSIPEEFFEELKGMASASDAQNRQSAGGCGSMLVLAVLPPSIYGILELMG